MRPTSLRGFNLQVFVPSSCSMIYSIVLLGLTFVNMIYVPQMTLTVGQFMNHGKNSTQSNTFLNKELRLVDPPLFIRLMNTMVMNLMGISSRINALFYLRRHLPTAFAALNAIDGFLDPELKQRRRNVRTIWAIFAASILVGMPSQIYSAIFVYMGDSCVIGIYVFMNNLNNFTAVLAEAQFLALCHLLKSRFESINRRFVELSTHLNLPPNDNSHGNMAGRIILTRAKVPSKIKCVTDLKKEFIANKEPRFKPEENLLLDLPTSSSIETLRLGHQRLCDVLDQANHIFQMQLFFSLSGCFLNLLFNMYSFFSGGAWLRRDNLTPTGPNTAANKALNNPLINLSWGLYYLIRFMSMTAMASKTTKAAKRTLVHILNIRRCGIDFATKEELSFFYDHVAGRKVEFSAAGFFNLDIKLISSVIATTSTYLVIMVQFQ